MFTKFHKIGRNHILLLDTQLYAEIKSVAFANLVIELCLNVECEVLALVVEFAPTN
jgi:hypothetical protein